MRYYRDPYGRLRVAPTEPARSPSGNVGRVTLEDYQKLAKAHQELQQRFAEQAEQLAAAQEAQATLADLRRELEIKNEALSRQSADMKQMEAELVWARAALQQQEKAEQPDEEDLSWRERYLRLQSELDALRRRWEQRFANEVAAARQEIMRDMLSLADHLELALRHGEELTGNHAREYVRNIEVIYQAFLATLRRYEVTQIDAQGKPFDPNLHEAVGTVHEPNMADGQVAEVIQTGYMEGEDLLRPARVLVNKRLD